MKWQSISATDYDLIGKFSGAAEGYILRYNGSAKTLVLVTNLGGFTTYSSTATITAVNDAILWVKITRQRSNGEVKFFTSPDGITYTQLGSTVSGSTAAINVGSSVVEIGSRGVGTTASTLGKIYRATISNSIGGTPVVDFNPASYNASTSQTAWTSATGEVWTINTDSAASGFAGRLVNRTICAFGGSAQTSQFVVNTSIQVNQPDTVYAAFKFDVFNLYQAIYDSNTTSTRQVVTNAAATGQLETNAGMPIIATGLVQNSLKLATSLYNGASSSLQVNNGTAITGNAGTQRMDGLRIGVLANGSPFTLKGIINTILVSSLNDNATTRTAMYNLIRSLNNNAF